MMQSTIVFTPFFPATRAPHRFQPWKQSHELTLTKWQHRERFLTLRACTGAGIFHAWHHLARYSFLKRVHRRFAAQIRRSHFCDIVQAAQDAARKHDMHRMFSLINRYAPKTARQRIQIRNQAGATASPDEELTQLKQFVADIGGDPARYHRTSLRPLGYRFQSLSLPLP